MTPTPTTLVIEWRRLCAESTKKNGLSPLMCHSLAQALRDACDEVVRLNEDVKRKSRQMFAGKDE